MTVDPSTLPLKEQHRLRAQLVRDGQRALNQATLTDYRAAKPTHKPKPTQTVTLSREGQSAELDVTDLRFTLDPTDPLGFAVARAFAKLAEPAPVPDKPRTQQDLLARLNARYAR